jgi:hypothetical protein
MLKKQKKKRKKEYEKIEKWMDLGSVEETCGCTMASIINILMEHETESVWPVCSTWHV